MEIRRMRKMKFNEIKVGILFDTNKKTNKLQIDQNELDEKNRYQIRERDETKGNKNQDIAHDYRVKHNRDFIGKMKSKLLLDCDPREENTHG